MKLSAPPIRSRINVSPHGNAPTTSPGYINPNKQKVIAATGARSSNRHSQTIYHLRCGNCNFDYGCNGLDIKARLCPKCQDGTPGETLRERPPSLFS